MVVRWIEDSPPAVRWLGMPPASCLQNPQFVSCYGAQAAQAIAECENFPIEVRGECQLYYNDYFAYTHCRNLCPDFNVQPVKPASISSQFPPGSGGGGGRLPPGRTQPTPSTATEDKTSPGLILAAVAVVGIVAYVALTS